MQGNSKISSAFVTALGRALDERGYSIHMLRQEQGMWGRGGSNSEIPFANIMPKQKIISMNGLYQGLLSDKPNEI